MEKSLLLLHQVFLDCEHILMTDYFENGQTFIGDDLLIELRFELVRKMRGSPINGHRAQQAVQTADCAAFNSCHTQLLHLNNSPRTFFLFLNLKKSSERCRFHDNEDASEAVEDWCLGCHSGSFCSQALLKVKERCQKYETHMVTI